MQEAVRDEAAGAIWILSEAHDANKSAIARAGGIPPTVELISSGTMRGQAHATEALASLGLSNVSNLTEITRLLVGVLSTGAPETKRKGADLLWRLVHANPETQTEMANAGSMSDLIG